MAFEIIPWTYLLYSLVTSLNYWFVYLLTLVRLVFILLKWLMYWGVFWSIIWKVFYSILLTFDWLHLFSSNILLVHIGGRLILWFCLLLFILKCLFYELIFLNWDPVIDNLICLRKKFNSICSKLFLVGFSLLSQSSRILLLDVNQWLIILWNIVKVINRKNWHFLCFSFLVKRK